MVHDYQHDSSNLFNLNSKQESDSYGNACEQAFIQPADESSLGDELRDTSFFAADFKQLPQDDSKEQSKIMTLSQMERILMLNQMEAKDQMLTELDGSGVSKEEPAGDVNLEDLMRVSMISNSQKCEEVSLLSDVKPKTKPFDMSDICGELSGDQKASVNFGLDCSEVLL